MRRTNMILLHIQSIDRFTECSLLPTQEVYTVWGKSHDEILSKMGESQLLTYAINW